MAIVGVRDVDGYGSTHDEEQLVVPLPLMDHNRTHTKHPSSSVVVLHRGRRRS